MQDDGHHDGLRRDLEELRRLKQRRQVLRWVLGAGVATAAGCQIAVDDSDGSGGGATNEDWESGECTEIPEETAGPYPGDGSNGKNALTLSGIVRNDIRTSLTGTGAEAEGIPLTVELTVIDTAEDCSPVEGYAVYLWHCDRDGNYSMYSSTVADESYLRGVQETNEDGVVRFTTIFPGCYSGRWPHIHFEIYPSLDEATDASQKILTSQLAMPEDVCSEAYATEGYEASVDNLAGTSLESDNVFGDGASLQLATVTGNPTDGYVAKLVVAI
ncbi:MAG: intradiol ring-cleavage dioxygenase [Myxococcales bacterium]|nr:intradiol ring-cleavage dioxygenase [Myxococcales bacterium]